MKKRLILPALLLAICLILSACQEGSDAQKVPENMTGTEENPSKETEEAVVEGDSGEDDIAEESLSGEESPETVVTPQGETASKATDEKKPGAIKDDTALADAQTDIDDSTLGSVLLLPRYGQLDMPRGGSTLDAYFQRDGVKGNGIIRIYDALSKELYLELDLSDDSLCYEVIDDGTMGRMGWNNGTHLKIMLPQIYENSGSYYIEAEQGAFSSSDGQIMSMPIEDDQTWRFDVANFGAQLATENLSDVYVGDELYVRVLVRKPAVKAVVEGHDPNRFSFDTKEIKHEDGDLRVTIKQLGEDTFYINFYNDERDVIGTLPVTYYASMPPEEDPEVKSGIIGL